MRALTLAWKHGGRLSSGALVARGSIALSKADAAGADPGIPSLAEDRSGPLTTGPGRAKLA